MLDIIGFMTVPFLVCVSMIAIFAYLGIHVLEREIIFIDIALAQMAAIGSALAFFIWHAEETSWIAYLSAFGFTVLAASFYAMARKRITHIPQEAVIGVSYAIAAAGALFLLATASGGDVHMEEMLTGNVLWADWKDLLICLGLYGIVGLFHILFRKRFQNISRSYSRGGVMGNRTELWDFLFYVSLGLVITYSVRLGGVLVVFSFLIIPATFSAMFSSRWSLRWIIAFSMGLVATVCGLVFSFLLDFSCGPSVVAFLGLELILGAILVRPRRALQTQAEAANRVDTV